MAPVSLLAEWWEQHLKGLQICTPQKKAAQEAFASYFPRPFLPVSVENKDIELNYWGRVYKSGKSTTEDLHVACTIPCMHQKCDVRPQHCAVGYGGRTLMETLSDHWKPGDGEEAVTGTLMCVCCWSNCRPRVEPVSPPCPSAPPAGNSAKMSKTTRVLPACTAHTQAVGRHQPLDMHGLLQWQGSLWSFADALIHPRSPCETDSI